MRPDHTIDGPDEKMSVTQASQLYADLEPKARRLRTRRSLGRWVGGGVAGLFVAATLLFALGSLTGLIGTDGSGPASGGDCTSEGAEISVVTRPDGSGFETSCFEVPSGTDLAITFSNTLPGSNSIAIFDHPPVCEVSPGSDGVTSFSCEPTAIFLGDPVTGIGSITYRLPPMDPGTYYFHSSTPDFYESLTGRLLVVEEPA